MPFRRAPADDQDSTALTFDQYASLCAELAVEHGAHASVYSRYNLDEEQQRREHGLWKARFRSDIPLAERFDAQVAVFRRWLENRRG